MRWGRQCYAVVLVTAWTAACGGVLGLADLEFDDAPGPPDAAGVPDATGSADARGEDAESDAISPLEAGADAPSAPDANDAAVDAGADAGIAAFVVFPGIDYGLNDLRSIENTSRTDCWAHCSADTACVGIVMGIGVEANRCWLKSRLGFPSGDGNREATIRASHPLARFPAPLLRTRGTGVVLAIMTSTNAEACAAACRTDDSCSGFWVETSERECTLLRGGIGRSIILCSDCAIYCDPTRAECP